MVNFSKCSFGIYLVHFFLQRDIIWNVPFVCRFGGYVQIVLTFVLTTGLSWLLTELISRCPVSEYIIGYKRGK